jgi:hypothetical protein
VPTPGRPGGAHAKASTRFLTDISPPTSETFLDAGISMDQIAARVTGQHTQLASLELAIESGETAGACDVGFACAYTNTISWRSANTPLPTENNPRAVFERLFGASSTDRRRGVSHQQDKSVLDSASSGDQARSAGRSRETGRYSATRFATSSAGSRRRRTAPGAADHRPSGSAATDERSMCDLQVLA